MPLYNVTLGWTEPGWLRALGRMIGMTVTAARAHWASLGYDPANLTLVESVLDESVALVHGWGYGRTGAPKGSSGGPWTVVVPAANYSAFGWHQHTAEALAPAGSTNTAILKDDGNPALGVAVWISRVEIRLPGTPTPRPRGQGGGVPQRFLSCNQYIALRAGTLPDGVEIVG